MQSGGIVKENDLNAPEPDALTLKGRAGFARILHATGYSLAGLQAAYRGEAAFRQLLLLNLVLLPVACMVDVTRSERALLVITPLLALIIELLNSAIEAAIDRISLAIHPLSKQAKDMGSAAQLLAIILIAVTWGMILL